MIYNRKQFVGLKVMSRYIFTQWICFFYIYCLLGWIWESIYVSIKEQKWINRGFLYGPLLPIYGCGAIAILFATLPVRQHLTLVFLFGMLAATILEYFTGMAMESLFKVRYWDYSNQKYNLNGYICLKCSIVWGLFSVILITLLHNPIESFVLEIKESFLTAILYPLIIITTIDIVLSFKNAFDLRSLLEELTELNENMKRMQRRLDVITAFIKEDKKMLGEKINERREYLEEHMENQYQYIINLQRDVARHLLIWKSSKENLEISKIEKLKELKNELLHISEQFYENKAYMKFHKEKKKKFRSIIKGNPTAVSIKYRKVFEELKESVKNTYSKR